MNKFLAIVFSCLLLAASSVYSTPKGYRVQIIYDRVLNASGMSGIPLHIERDPSINASAGCGGVTINTGSINALNDNELAWMIGHELGHIKLGHTCGGKMPWKMGEAQADIYGVKVGMAAGYNTCAGGASFFKKLIAMNGGADDPTDEHPGNSYRLKNVQNNC